MMINLDNDAIYRNIMEETRDILLVVDAGGNIIMANKAAVAAYGYSGEELRSMRVYDLRSPETRAAVDAQLAVAQQEGILFRTIHMRRTGEAFPVEVSSRRVCFPDGEAVISVVRDVTATVAMETAFRQGEAKYRLLHEELAAAHEELTASEEELRQQLDEMLAREEAIRRRNLILSSLHEIAVELMERRELSEVLRLIVAKATEVLGTPHGSIRLVDEEKGVFHSDIGLGHYAQHVRQGIKLTEGLSGRVYRSGEIAIVDNYNTWEHRLPGAVFDQLHCIAQVPLKTGDKVIGIIGASFLTPERNFTDQDIFFLSKFADMASIAVRNAQLLRTLGETERDLRKNNEELTAAYEELVAQDEELKQQFDELLAIKEAIKTSEAKYRAIFEAANDGIYIHDSNTGEILDVNEKICSMYGYTREEILAGNLDMLGTGEAPFTGREARQWIERAAAGKAQLFEWQKRHKDGHYIWAEINLQKVTIGREERVLAIVRDISERKEHEQAIRRLAYRDSLTGLPNRACLKEFLEAEMEKVQRGERSGAVLFIDLDNLKTVNDTFGHSFGDGVIIKAGAYVCAEAGGGAFVARIGGDEFIVVLPGETDRAKVDGIAAEMVKELEQKYDIGPLHTYMSASIGIAFYPGDGDTVEDILKKADLALYAAKGSGKNTWRFYEAGLQKAAYDDMLIRQGLREAIGLGELSLHYQPLVSMHTSEVVSFEALLRWNSAELGPVPPGRFIPLAEESDIIQVIGSWVIDEACRFVRTLSDMGKSDIYVSVNVSPRQLAASGFVPFVREAVRAAGIRPNQLGIEITEHTLIASMEESVQKLKELRALGVHISLDDFGSGYCSLLYLKKLPVEILKIDKAFIDDIASDEDQLHFVNSIVNMVHVQGLSVVGEGVETEAQLHKLKLCQCDAVQGYVFSRPMPEAGAISLLGLSQVPPSKLGRM